VSASITLAERSHEPDSLRYFNALLDRRAYIHSANTWPMDIRSLGRLLFYLTIPPLAWIGAALVEMLVQGFVDAA
jgi:hypothetical protein